MAAAYVSTAVLAAAVEAGARPALPGEFTERAVRNGKLDLLQAEADRGPDRRALARDASCRAAPTLGRPLAPT